MQKDFKRSHHLCEESSFEVQSQQNGPSAKYVINACKLKRSSHSSKRFIAFNIAPSRSLITIMFARQTLRAVQPFRQVSNCHFHHCLKPQALPEVHTLICNVKYALVLTKITTLLERTSLLRICSLDWRLQYPRLLRPRCWSPWWWILLLHKLWAWRKTRSQCPTISGRAA